jgi:NAD(P)H-hydrate epimerase
MPFADSCLAKAGSGDMLAGIIAGFAAQGASAYDAARLGVFLHASAGSYAKKEAGQAYSVTIPDLIDSIPTAFRSILSSS